jgi:hypothetical protein
MVDKEIWKFINTFAPWFSALGTFAAVVVSLYLARISRRVRLKVSAGLEFRSINREHLEVGRYICIRIINVGYREAIITNIRWQAGFLGKYAMNQQIDSVETFHNPALPIRLKEQEYSEIYLELSDDNFATAWPIRDYLSFRTKIRLYSVRLQVTISTGKIFSSRIDRGLRSEFNRMIKSRSTEIQMS